MKIKSFELSYEKKFIGVHAVLYALFKSDGFLDCNAMIAQAQLMIDNKIDGINVLGLATEVQKLSLKEQAQIIQIISKTVDNKIPLSVTVTGNSIHEQREKIEIAIACDADLIILQPPTLGLFSTEVYVEFFKRVTSGYDCPFAIQYAPQYLGSSFNIEKIDLFLKEITNLRIIKAECNAVDFAKLSENLNKKLLLMNGRGGKDIISCMETGASGFILAPDVIDFSKYIFDIWHKGYTEEASNCYSRILPSISFIMESIEHLICYGKRLFALRAGFTIHDRLPALAPTNFGIKTIEKLAYELGSFGLKT